MSTLLHRLHAWSTEAPFACAQRFKTSNGWHSINAEEYWQRVFHLALYLESEGLNHKDISLILSYNCPQWVHMDLAPMLLGAKSAGLYPNSTDKDIRFILELTQAPVIAVQNESYYLKIAASGGVPDFVRRIIVFEGTTTFDRRAISYDDAITKGANLARARKPQELLFKIKPTDPAFLIFTSGTTGNPKGAVLSHENLAFTSSLVIENWEMPADPGDLFSFLPLCHIAEKLQNLGVGISRRYTVNFCSSFDNIAKELPEVQPTLLLCVPRLWEKMREGVQQKLSQAPALKKKLAQWAFKVGAEVGLARVSGRGAGLWLRMQFRLADKIILSKVRAALGLGRVTMSASGAAALNADVGRWFRSLGVNIFETFGQTETTGIITMVEPGVDGFGTVGRPAPGIDFRIASDGEILTRGPHVFLGYFKNSQATAEALEEDGWLHTGDLGEITPEGWVRIIGRKKEILKTSGGKMVAPVPIEERLKASGMISQVCMVGDGRKCLSALITLNESLCKSIKQKLSGVVDGVVVKDPDVVSEVKNLVDQLNNTLSSYERIRFFTVLSEEFTVEKGEMTPTLKMKRNVIEKNYKPVIDRMYS